MSRAAVTACAVVLFFVSTLMLFIAMAIFLVPVPANQSPFLRSVMYVTALLAAALSAWGVITGVGLLRLREWARLSLILGSVLLLAYSLRGFITTVLLPIPTSPGQNEELLKRVSSMRASMIPFYGTVIFLCVLCLWFLNRRTVKEQFWAPITVAATTLRLVARPLSISVIGWYLLIIAFLLVPILLFRIPLILFGRFLKGSSAMMVTLTIFVLHPIMAIGLLKLKRWAWILSLSYLTFWIMNALASALIPGRQVRIAEFQDEIRKIVMTAPVFGTAPMHLHLLIWSSFTFSLVPYGIAVYFLIKNRQAFQQTTSIA